MAHRRIKNIDFDDGDDYDEDYDGYDDGATGDTTGTSNDGLTDEDREQLRLGTAHVREQLRDYESISDAAIQEALYHYWYDVEKTVIYLKNENRPAEKKQPKALSKFDQAASASAEKAGAVLTNGNATTKKSTKKTTKDDAKMASAVDDLAIDDTPRDRPRIATKIQSKNLDVVAEFERAHGKKELNVVIAGHVDHGKSTLMGRLLFESSMVDQRTLDKYRKEAAKIGKESFALAWVMDARDDEREHGITIDYSEKVFETPTSTITILDAPGHRDYVGNMIAGTSMADCALLVVDAGTNSFLAGLKGQTKEHAQVIRAMKLEKLIVAVNKMDSVSWSQPRFEEVCTQAAVFLEECLFEKENIIFVPCAGLSGSNISKPLESSDASWYKGPTLVEALEKLEPDRAKYLQPASAPFRMRITGLAGLSEFSEFASNSSHVPFAVLGRVDAGNVQVGDSVISLPTGEEAIVKGITRHGRAADWAVAGQLIGLQLSNCDEERFNRGDVICSATRPAGTVRRITMKILAFDTVFPMPVEVHRGRMRAAGTITELVARLDRRNHGILKEGPKLIKEGEVARVVIEFEEPLALERPSRVVLRYGGQTIAAGAVEKGQ